MAKPEQQPPGGGEDPTTLLLQPSRVRLDLPLLITTGLLIMRLVEVITQLLIIKRTTPC
jgi:hypothetical protein